MSAHLPGLSKTGSSFRFPNHSSAFRSLLLIRSVIYVELLEQLCSYKVLISNNPLFFSFLILLFGLDHRYLVPRDMSVGQLIHILSGRLHLAPGKALFVFVNNTLPHTTSLMETVYDSFKDKDGFLYMCYSSEKTFGRANS
ncbi:autophagy-related protein 8h-like [Nicotiana tomentosiformis]|uniref:autophagy-related protein 8h-like n=1 Tax=Nicotiana tomentosiformis TaxID=4098 RepID=UPI00388CD9E8